MTVDLAGFDGAFDAWGDDDPLVGSEIGNRYRIERLLGMGGMGSVYAATQVQIERPVAIKVMRVVDSTAMERFRREAVTIGKLGHPNIISIYDVGRLPDGRPYMVMPRITGPDLGEMIGDGQTFSPDEVVALLRGPASALDTMHGAGFVHRDIKPDNLMIDELSNGERRVLLLDFGLTQMMVDERARLTRDGLVSGTPHYISPEGAHGHKVTGVSDVYSLAAVAFELLTGRPPFDDDSPVQILVQKAQQDPPTLASMGVFVTEQVEEVLAIGLARDPENRYGSASTFIDALTAAAQGRSDEPSAVHAKVEPHDRRTVIELDPEPLAVASTPPPSEAREPVDPQEVPGLRRGGARRAAAIAAVLLAIGGGLALVAWPGASEPTVSSAPRGESTDSAPQRPDTTAAEPSASEPSASEPSASEPTASEPTASEPSASEPSASEPSAADTSAAAATAAEPAGPEPGSAPPAEARAVQPRQGARGLEVARGASGRARRRGPAEAGRVGSEPPTPAPIAAGSGSPEPAPAAEAPPSAAGAPAPDLEVARARVQEGTRALMAGMLPRAIARFREATLAAPRHAPAWRGLGLANERLGRTAEARRAYRRYLAIAPGAADASEIATRLGRLGATDVLASDR